MIQILPEFPHRIDRRVYGQFAEHLGRCVSEGIWVGTDSDIPNKNGIRSDVISALRHIKVPLVRWPGGCFADEYHWLKGVGPERQPMVNTNWGGVIETNEFGTHEYFELLHQLDAEAYINGNVGSGTVAEMSAQVLSGAAPDAHNDFSLPDAVAPTELRNFRVQGAKLSAQLPPAAVATVRVRVS